MWSQRRRLSFLLPGLTLVLILSSFPLRDAYAQTCTPAACSGVFHLVDFEGATVGTTVEGLGAVDPLLTITSVAWPHGPSCSVSSALVIQEGNAFPYSAYSAGASVVNGCLGGNQGFGDDQGCVLDYDFTFAPGVAVSCFSIRILDYGDYFPFGGSAHQVLLTAYDASSTVVDQDALNMLGGVDLGGGDACVTQPSVGDTRLSVAGSGIVRVTLRFDAWPDPNLGYDEIAFCALAPTPAALPSWGRLKSIYR